MTTRRRRERKRTNRCLGPAETADVSEVKKEEEEEEEEEEAMAGGRDEGARAAATAARRRSSPAGQGLSWARVPSPVNDSRPSRPPSLSEPHSRGRTCTSLPVALARLVPLTISPLSPDQTPRHVEPPSSSTAAAAPLARIGPVAARRDQHCRHVGFGSVVPPPAERAQGLVPWRSNLCFACRCAPCLPPRPHQCELSQADAGAPIPE